MHIDTITRASPTISTSSIVGEWVIACVVIVTDIILWQGHHDRVMQLNLLYLFTLFMWHMPDDAIEGVAEQN